MDLSENLGAMQGLPVVVDERLYQKAKPSLADELKKKPSKDWSKEDIARQVAYLGLQLIDWNQSKDIARHPEKYYEGNPLLGKHPSQGRLNSYTIGTMIGHTALMHLLSPEWRKRAQTGSILFEGNVVLGNHYTNK